MGNTTKADHIPASKGSDLEHEFEKHAGYASAVALKSHLDRENNNDSSLGSNTIDKTVSNSKHPNSNLYNRNASSAAHEVRREVEEAAKENLPVVLPSM